MLQESNLGWEHASALPAVLSLWSLFLLLPVLGGTLIGAHAPCSSEGCYHAVPGFELGTQACRACT